MPLLPLFSAKFLAVFSAYCAYLQDQSASVIAGSYIIAGAATFAVTSAAQTLMLRPAPDDIEILKDISALDEARKKPMAARSREASSPHDLW